ncbi:hypothetical protein QUB80_18030 [Chlorogloeopsis sp. ULAP01]|uniref:hypothetical protein n=1 Tax=Chlorogloeopsis sp. ULAP01 TaxID=3056483 RepID=UPI0025AAAA13|nr:hypothetical protein [Chlorogloeopsis sp. ULAP01]MDM9382600.1 hypothetical protein [Chlorogloeopsis sp. ULAP01]
MRSLCNVQGVHQLTFVRAGNIEDADGDLIFLQQHPQADNYQHYQHITNHPLWLQLNAVQPGKVHEVSDDYWHRGSYIAANRILDDLFKYFVDKQ